MPGARSTFDKVKLMALLENHLERGMNKAVLWVVSRVRKRLNRSQPTKSIPSGSRVGLDPSRPGESPKKVIGELQNSIRGRVNRTGGLLTGWVGSGLKKSRRLELGFVGTVRIPAHERLGGKIRGRKGFRFVHSVKAHTQVVNQAARPFVRPAIFGNRSAITRIIANG